MAGLTRGQQAGEVAQFHVIDRSLDRAAVGMADDRDQFCARNLAGEFHAAEDVLYSTRCPRRARLKMSPMPWSVTSSMGWRESRQLRTTAKGYWPAAEVLSSSAG